MNIENRATKLYLKKLPPVVAVELLEKYMIPSPYKEIINAICIKQLPTFKAIDFLSKEHKMIALYNDVAKVSKEEDRLDIKPYEIPLLKYRGWKYSVFKAMLSPTEIILYGTIILGLILFGVLYR